MKVYDFDKTIYKIDSSADFYIYCLKRFPLMFLTFVPTAIAFTLYLLRLLTKTQFKQQLFTFLRYVPDAEAEAERFWKTRFHGIGEWYYAQKRNDDLVISASPEFLLKPISEKLGFSLIASPVSPADGRFIGENCHGEEKVRRFREVYPDAVPEEFYSDSLSDTPMARISKKAFMVKHGVLTPWEEYKPSLFERIKYRKLLNS